MGKKPSFVVLAIVLPTCPTKSWDRFSSFLMGLAWNSARHGPLAEARGAACSDWPEERNVLIG